MKKKLKDDLTGFILCIVLFWLPLGGMALGFELKTLYHLGHASPVISAT
jgi:hypothetical protein